MKVPRKVLCVMGLAGVVVTALTACGGGGAPTAGGTVSGNTSATGALTGGGAIVPVVNPSSDEQQILDAVNAARAQPRDCDSSHHFAATGPLTWNAQLAGAALAHSKDMAANGYRESTVSEPDAPHNGSDGSTPQQRISRAGYNWSYSGENVAAGFTVGGANDVVQAWLQSPGHCENIMNPKFREIGVSAIFFKGAKYNSFFTQDFGTK
jgi:uncharacterized protein YkwD